MFEVLESGIYRFKDIHTVVPATLRDFPLQGLDRNLKTVVNKPTAGNLQRTMQSVATVPIDFHTDLYTSPDNGEFIREVSGDEHEKWAEYGLNYEQGLVTEAILRTVGRVWDPGRMFLDALTFNGRIIAVISADGYVVGDTPEEQKWFMRGDQWFQEMTQLIKDIEAKGIYGAIVADVKRPTRHGLHKPVTQGIPFFYTADASPRYSKPGK